ncbi:membrane protein [Acinetobacter sp. A47]|uniref:membrane protein n=1 Tax=Acinetobacter sp. A47 TaxID=1561217 RepID=UPI000570DEC4|nr:membrane protein [Acinetobacter sp. A47]
MQDTTLSRWFAPVMAFCLSFVMITTLAPTVGIQIDRQFDFWLLWLGTMLLLALPIGYLEIALAKRSQTTALQALSSLTRDADASPRWRLVGWLAVVFVPFFAGSVLTTATQVVKQQLALDFSSQILFAGLAVVALAFSFIPRQFLIILTTIGVVAAFILANVMGTKLQAWHWTGVEFKEWGNATVLALVASGLGLGLYWQSSLAVVKKQDAATASVLPIWIAQLLAVIAFGFFSIQTQLPALAWGFAALMSAALLIQFAKEQLAQRQLAVVVQWAILLAAIAVWAVPQVEQIFNTVLMLWGLIICLIYAVFAGWIMKISHLRKAMGFSNELFYNLWRIAVRIVLPLSIIVAIVAVIGQVL